MPRETKNKSLALSEYEVQRNENVKKITAKMAEIDLAVRRLSRCMLTIEKPMNAEACDACRGRFLLRT